MSACFGLKPSTDGGCHFGIRKSRQWGRQQATNRRTGKRTIDDYETPCPPNKPSLGPQMQLEPCTMQQNITKPLHVGQPLWFWRHGANAAKKPTNAFWHPRVVISNTLGTVWIAYRGSAVKCARSQVRPFHEDDDAAHEHMRRLENCYMKATSRTKTSLNKMNLQWTAHL